MTLRHIRGIIRLEIERHGVVVSAPASYSAVHGSNLGSEIGYRKYGFFMGFLIPSGQGWVSTLKWTTIAIFDIITNS
jgi:hypothetical protein